MIDVSPELQAALPAGYKPYPEADVQALVDALAEGIELEEGELVGLPWKKAIRAWGTRAKAALAKFKESRA